MIERLESLIGTSEIEAFSRAIAERPAKSVRPRADRGVVSFPFATTPVAWYPQGLEVTDPAARPGGFLEYAVADYYIQDAGSMLPLALLEIEPDDWVCDLCAAPGGKATAIAERLGPNGFLLANEVIASRLDILRYALSRTGRANYVVSNIDPQPLADGLAHRFDKVLVDVPCSGQSLVGRKRQSESSFAPNHVHHCAARAKRILRSALRLVRPGGRLIFSTCTFAIEENEAQLAEILAEYPNAVSIVDAPALKPWLSPLHQGCYRLWPHRDRCAGGFAAAVQITDQIDQPPTPRTTHSSRREKSPQRRKISTQKSGVRAKDLFEGFEDLGEFLFQKTFDDSLCLGYEPAAYGLVKEFGSRFGQGLRIAQIQRDRIEPFHGLALLTPDLFSAAETIELDDQDAKNYMLGQSIPQKAASREAPSRAVGSWCVAHWKGKPLGWLKPASNRFNNYLPSWARFTSFVSPGGSTLDDEPLE